MRAIAVTPTLAAALLGACSADSIISTANTGWTQATGRVSLSVSIDTSRTQTLSGTTYTKKEFAQGNYAYDLATLQGQVGGHHFAWHDTMFGGFASWYEEFTQPTTVQIPGTTNYRDCTRVDSTSYSSSTVSLPGHGDVDLNIYSDNTYQVSIDGGGGGLTTEAFESSNDCSGQVIRTQSPPVQSTGGLFTSYFNSNTLSAGGSRPYVTGTIAPGSNRANGVLQWIDSESVVVFSNGGTQITVPVHVTLTWDFTLQ